MSCAWEPVCSLENLQLRAQMLTRIRGFFAEHGVLEVETPLLCHGVGTDPNLDFFSSRYAFVREEQEMFLQTSPEFAMKRLLASGSGSIYQISKAFRNAESGRLHNPEFTLLEWYRVDFDLLMLMDEIVGLVASLLVDSVPSLETRKISYSELFHQYTGLDPLHFSLADYVGCAQAHALHDAQLVCADEHATWLDFLFCQLVQPYMETGCLYLIYHYPACLPSLARFNTENSNMVERVEIFFNGVELGNGYHELSDVAEQSRRFDHEINMRKHRGLPMVVADQHLLAALSSGLPDCAGMAIGLDRLLMLLAGATSINDVLAFPIDSA